MQGVGEMGSGVRQRGAEGGEGAMVMGDTPDM